MEDSQGGQPHGISQPHSCPDCAQFSHGSLRNADCLLVLSDEYIHLGNRASSSVLHYLFILGDLYRVIWCVFVFDTV